MEADFQSRLNAMIAASDGKIWIESSDRDTETQTRLWNEAVAKYGEEEARNWVAPPGHSYHEKGLAADLGGDLELAAQLAPEFGLWFPMPGPDWEPWHIEPIGSRGGERGDDPLSYTNRPTDSSALVGGADKGAMTWADSLSNMLGIKAFQPQSKVPNLARAGSTPENIVSGNPGFMPPDQDLSKLVAGPTVKVPGSDNAFGGRNGSDLGTTDLDKFMAALRAVESSGDYGAEGVPTPWGTATGAYQYLDGTWDNYKGYARAKDAPPEIQDEKARADMQRYYNEYGSWDSVASAWYSGPGGNWQSGEVQTYVQKVRSNL